MLHICLLINRHLLQSFNELEVCHYRKFTADNINVIFPVETSVEQLGQAGQVSLQQGGVSPDQGERQGGQEDPRLALRLVGVVAVDYPPHNTYKLNTGFGVHLDAVKIPGTVNGRQKSGGKVLINKTLFVSII